MSLLRSNPEVLILSLLDSVEILTMEQAVELLPELSWVDVFRAIDALSRCGTIILRRRGFDYEVARRPRIEASLTSQSAAAGSSSCESTRHLDPVLDLTWP
jgi:hypothetical protein